MILVFDLDGTLYDEIGYVESGFAAVARYAAGRWQLDESGVYRNLIDELSNSGRGQVFDSFLNHHGKLSAKNVKACLGVYRQHVPSIQLHQAGANCLQRFQSWTKYLVTDGNKVVQNNKVVALQLQPMFKRIMITHRFGVSNAKPSPYCFNLIAQAEKCEPGQIVYIGDDPSKDFVGIKPLGFKTIRVLTGMHRAKKRSEEYEAHLTIDTLEQLTPTLLNQLQKL